MHTLISLLRGINVSGQKKIRMDDLKALYQSLGLENVKTYIQSGNVIFDTTDSNASTVSLRIENEIKRVYNYSVSVFIRTRNDLQNIIQSNPFLKDKSKDTNRLYVTFLSQAPNETTANELKVPENDLGEFYISDKEIYLFCPTGYGITKLSNNFFERKLGLAATSRNWNTVNKLFELSG